MKPIQVYDGDGSRTDIPSLELTCNVMEATFHLKKGARSKDNSSVTVELRYLGGSVCQELCRVNHRAWCDFTVCAGDRMLLLVNQINRAGKVMKEQQRFEGVLVSGGMDNIGGKDRLIIELEFPG